MKKIILILTILLITASSAYAYSIDWSETNGPYTGYAINLAMTTQETIVILAPGKSGGLFRSTNEAASWQKVVDTNAAFLSVAIDPTDQDKMYACVAGDRIWYSSDRGATWVKDIPGATNTNIMTSTFGDNGENIAIDPNDPSKIYMGGLYDNRLYRIDISNSPDPCTWEVVTTFVDRDHVREIMIEPNNSNIFVKATGAANTTYRSTNEGASFEQVMGNQTFIGAFHDSIYLFDTSNIWKSTNEGDSFYPLPIPPSAVSRVSVNPADTDTVYAVLNGILKKSTDSGLTWDHAYNGLPAVHGTLSIAVNPLDENKVFVSTNGDGIYKTTDSGLNWERAVKDFTNAQFVDISIDPITHAIYAVSANSLGRGSGIWKSTNKGETWEKLKDGILSAYDMHAVEVDLEHPGHVYAGGQSGAGMFKSTDHGSYFAAINQGLLNQEITDIVIDYDYPADGQTTVYVSTLGDGVFKGDAGSNGVSFWIQLPITGLGDTNTSCLALDSTTEGHSLYAGTANGGIFKFNLETETTWEVLDASDGGTIPNSSSLTDIAVDSTNSNYIYATTYDGTNTISGLYVSTNEGSTWSKKDSNRYYSLYIDYWTVPYTVYAVYWSGIKKSTNYGQTWVEDTGYNLGYWPVSFITRDEGDFTFYTASRYYAIGKGIPNISVPPTPTNFSGIAQSPSTIQWSWDDISGEFGYKLYDGSNNLKAIMGENINTHTEPGLSPNTEYTRKVTAFGTLESGYSNTYTEYTHANKPTSLRIGDRLGDSIGLKWNINSNPLDTTYIMEGTLEAGTFDNASTIEVSSPPPEPYGHYFTGLTPNTTYKFRAYAVNENGISTEISNIITESTTHETLGPRIFNIRFDGIILVEGDVIRPAPLITADLTDEATYPESPSTIEKSSIILDFSDEYKIYGDNIDSFVYSPSEGVYKLYHQLTTPLGAGEYIFSITAEDALGNVGSSTPKTVKVIPGAVHMIGPTVAYPTPFSPVSEGGEATITYTLSTDAPVKIFMYDIGGKVAWTRRFAPKANGGRTGYNEVKWNGITDFGGYAGNGIYVYKVVSGDRVIGKGKIVIYD